MTESIPNSQEYWQQQTFDVVGVDSQGQQLFGHSVIQAWWQNPINHTSLRLTSVGYKWFTVTAKFKFHEVKLTAKILPRQMLQLEKLITSPYYIKSSTILYVFSETDAVMLHLHGGDLNTYLDNLEQNI